MKINKKNPIVSVMILTFNSERFIRRCLDSMLSQTYKDFELIIVDAGSKDKTLELVKTYFNKININLLHAPGSSIGEARNIALRNSIGKYICFCDSDDFFFPDKLKMQVATLNKYNDAKIATYSGFLHFNEGDPEIFHSPRPIDKNIENNQVKLLLNQIINLSGLMVKNIEKPVLFSEGSRGLYGEDFQYNISLLASGYSFKFTDGNYSAVSIRDDSYTNWEMQAKLKWYVILHIYHTRQELADKGFNLKEVDYILKKHWFKFSIACFASNDYGFNLLDQTIEKFVPKYIKFIFLFKKFLIYSKINILFRFFWTIYRNQKKEHVKISLRSGK